MSVVPVRRIALSQREDVVDARAERRDALDQAWTPLLRALGLWPVPVPNRLDDAGQWAEALGIHGLLLTGGGDIGASSARDRTEARLLNWATALGRPVFGVCRGLQMLNVHLGGGLRPVVGHVATRHPLWPANAPAGRAGIRSREVNSFHAWAIAAADLAPSLEPLWCDADGHVEAARHRSLRWTGIMWHPEREAVADVADLDLLRSVFLTSTT